MTSFHPLHSHITVWCHLNVLGLEAVIRFFGLVQRYSPNMAKFPDSLQFCTEKCVMKLLFAHVASQPCVSQSGEPCPILACKWQPFENYPLTHDEAQTFSCRNKKNTFSTRGGLLQSGPVLSLSYFQLLFCQEGLGKQLHSILFMFDTVYQLNWYTVGCAVNPL